MVETLLIKDGVFYKHGNIDLIKNSICILMKWIFLVPWAQWMQSIMQGTGHTDDNLCKYLHKMIEIAH